MHAWYHLDSTSSLLVPDIKNTYAQVGFYEVIVSPLMTNLAYVFPSALPLVAGAISNMRWLWWHDAFVHGSVSTWYSLSWWPRRCHQDLGTSMSWWDLMMSWFISVYSATTIKGHLHYGLICYSRRLQDSIILTKSIIIVTSSKKQNYNQHQWHYLQHNLNLKLLTRCIYRRKPMR